MKWKPKDRPKDGDKRSRRFFAWMPTKIGCYTVWLEQYEVHEVFRRAPNNNFEWWAELSRNALEPYY